MSPLAIPSTKPAAQPEATPPSDASLQSQDDDTFAQLLGQSGGEAKSPAAARTLPAKADKTDAKSAEEMAAMFAGFMAAPVASAPLALAPELNGETTEAQAALAQEKTAADSLLPNVSDAVPAIFSAKSLATASKMITPGNGKFADQPNITGIVQQSGDPAVTTADQGQFLATLNLAKSEEAMDEAKLGQTQTAANALTTFLPKVEKNAEAVPPADEQIASMAQSGLAAEPVLTRVEKPRSAVGTSAAMQRPVMSQSTLLEKPALAGKPAPTFVAESKTTVATGEKKTGAEPESNGDALPQQFSSTADALQGASILAKPLAEAAPASALEKSAPNVTTALHQVLETADRMRSDGQTHVELQVKLQGGEELTIKLQMQDGTVRAVFKTESTELRQAIEQNWSGFSGAAADRGVRVTTPVFEASNAQAGLNNFANRDSRRQARDFAETDGAEAGTSSRSSLKKTGSGLATIRAPFSRIQRYA